MEENKIYSFLKENGLTQKSESDFLVEYSDSAKAQELHKFFSENKLTYKDFGSFYDEYLKKKEQLGAEASSSVAEPTTSAANKGLVSTPTNEILAEQEEPKPVEEQSYSEEEIAGLESLDRNPTSLAYADAETRKKYVDYKRKKQEKYTVTQDERNDAKAALEFVNSELEDVNKEWKDKPKIKQPTTPRVSFFGDVQYETKEEEQNVSVLRDKKRLLEESKQYLSAVANGDKQNGIERFWEGVKTLDVPNFMSLGIKDLIEGVDVANIANKLEAEGEESLSQDEKDILILNNIRNEAEQAAMEDRAFAVGSGIAETVPFIADMVVTSGAGAALRKGVFKGTANIVKNKAARKLVSNLSDATARAYMFPSTYEKAAERAAPQIGFNEELEPIITEKGEDMFEALAKAGAENTVEIFSEGAIGAGLSKLVGRATKKGVQLMGNSKFTKIFDAVQNAGKNSPILKMSAIQDPFTEFGEEIFAGVVQPIVTGDGSPKDFFEYENMIRTAMTVGIMSSAMATPSYAIGARNVIRTNKGREVFNSLSDIDKEVFSEAAQTDDINEATNKMKTIHQGLIKYKTNGSTDEEVVRKAVKESNQELARLNDYYASVKKAQREAAKFKTPTYQVGDRVYRDKESFFKEVDKNLNGKNGLPFVEIRNDSAAETELRNKFDSKVEPIEEKAETPAAKKETKTTETTTNVEEKVSQKKETLATEDTPSRVVEFTGDELKTNTKQDESNGNGRKEVQGQGEQQVLGTEPKEQVEQKSGKEEKGDKADAEAEVVFKPFADVVKKSKSADEAFAKVSKIKNVPKELAVKFREKYDPEQKLTPRQAFDLFYNEIKPPKATDASTEPLSTTKGVGVPTEKKVAEKGAKEKSVEKTIEDRNKFLNLQNEKTKDKGTDIVSKTRRTDDRGTGVKVGVPRKPRVVVGGSNRVVSGTPVKKYSVSNMVAAALEAVLPKSSVDKLFVETKDAQLFHDRISKSKEGNKFSASVFVYPVEDYNKYRLFMTEDGNAGVAIDDKGTIISVFSFGTGQGRAAQMVINAVMEGGTHLDHFNTGLTKYYYAFGFIPVARVKFNEEFAPDDWDYETYKQWNNGRPDVVLMAYMGGNPDTLHERLGKFGEYEAALENAPYYDTFEEAQAAQAKIVEQLKQDTSVLSSGQENKLTKVTGIKPKNLRDTYRAGREIFGLNRSQALAQAIIVNTVVNKIAKNRGVTTDKVWSEIEFRKGMSNDAQALYQAVWHGSPYEFDKFRLDKIGTGEGAQAFGWGIYFTDKKSIAEVYAKLADEVNEEPFDILNDDNIGEDVINLDEFEYFRKELSFLGVNKRGSDAIAELEEMNALYKKEHKLFSKSKKEEDKRYVKHLEEQIAISDEVIIEAKKYEKANPIKSRNLYRVKLHGDRSIDEFNYLRWDKPTDGKVKELLNEAGIPTEHNGKQRNGDSIYEGLSGKMGAKEASLFLLRAGIDGIKYPTEITRKGTHEESFNYVIFDENVAEIEEHIKFQKQGTGKTAKGAIQFLADGNAIISALTNPNVSTPLHEIAHLYERYMPNSERKAVLKWAKHKTWSTETSEMFARGFEKYLATGKAPLPSLEGVFRRFKAWLTDIYNGITGSEIDIQLNDAMIDIYSAMLGADVVQKVKKQKPVEYKKTFKDVDDLLFQDGVLFQGEDKTEKHTQAVNKLVDNFEKEGEKDVAKAVREYLGERGNPVSEEVINNVLKERGYAKEQQSRSLRTESEQDKGQGTGDSNLSEVNGAELQDGKETKKEEVKPSRFGLRYFTELSKVPKATQEAIAKSGITNYKTTSLQEADDISTEIVANNTTKDLTDMILNDVDMNNALWVAIATKTQQKLDKEIYAAKKRGESATELANLQMSIVKRVTADVSAAGLLLRAVQAGFVTDYLAPITWVKAYIDAVKNKKAESEKSKWLKRSLANFESKVRKVTEKSVEQTLEKARKETERAEKKLNKEPKKEVSKVDSIMREWQKAINKRRGGVLFQAAKKEFEWTEEDIDFAKQVVTAYVESGIYARPVLENKIKNKFAKFGITINDNVLESIIPKEFGGKSLDDLFEEQQLDDAAEALAGRIFGEVIDKEAKPTDPMKIMVSTLLGKFREREKAPQKEKKSAMENIVAAIRGVKEYEQVWSEAKGLAIDKVKELDISEFEKELAIEKIENAYNKATNFTFTENQVKSIVRKYIRDNQIKMADIVRSHLSIRNATRESIKKGIIAMSGLDGKEADILAKSISDIWERTLRDNSKSIVDRETKRMKDKIAGVTRTSVQKTEIERLLDMIILGAFEDAEFRDAYSAIKGIPQLDAAKAAKIESLAEKVRVTPSTTVKRMRKQDLLMYMRQIDGVEWGELADTVWYGFILGNVPTQVRNTVGAFGNTYGVLLAEALTNPLKIPQILRSQKRGGQMGIDKAGVILRTGKQFFENVTDMPAFSEYAKGKQGSGMFKYIAYLMRWMSANDQTSMSIGKESFAALLAEEHLKVNRFRKAYDPKYRKAINEAVDKLLSITPEQISEINRLVDEEAVEFDYDVNEKIVRRQELIDEARPKDLLMEAEKAASRATGNTKAYGTLAQVVDKITWLPRNFEIPITYKDKTYSFRPFKMLATFTRISTAIANLQLGFTPIGYFNVLWNKHGFFKDSNFNSEMTPPERKQMLMRATFGTLTIAMLYSMVNPDDDDNWLTITANGTGNYKDNEELRNNSKWRPYSIYLGGMDGMRVSYRYSPFSLMLATVGYMSDRKKYVKKHKDTPEMNLLLQAMLWYPPFLSETTPLGTSIKFLGDVFGGVGYGESKIDPGKMVKTLANTAKGYYAPSIYRDITDFADYVMKDYKAENNELYNSMIDRTPLDLLPIPKEDGFPSRDAWGLPVERINSLDEFVGIGNGDVHTELIRYHWDNAGVLGKPQRDGLFELWYNDGSMQAGQITRKHRETRELWNEVYLKNRGEYLREAVLELKSRGITGEEYVKEFNKKKAYANERAKDDVRNYSMINPLDKSYKEDK